MPSLTSSVMRVVSVQGVDVSVRPYESKVFMSASALNGVRQVHALKSLGPISGTSCYQVLTSAFSLLVTLAMSPVWLLSMLSDLHLTVHSPKAGS